MTNLATLLPDQLAMAPLAALYKACGDPLRLEILRVLRRDTFGVLELSQMFDIRQSGMSHHLKVLSKAGLVESQREGNAIFYRRPLLSAHGDLQALAVRQVFALVDSITLPSHLISKIREIREQRAEQSQAFFARYAEQFREQQELIAEHAVYAGPASELLHSRWPIRQGGAALEIGPGEGAFLPVLAGLFTRVVAVDNSADMLARAQTHCQQQRLDGIEYVLGETGAVLEHGGEFDLIVANMVLHHVPSPPDIFADAAALLAPDGRLLITELCSHAQDWVREACGDLWLGFEPEELSAWAQEAGLTSGEVLFIGLRNGFQIQVREFLRAQTPSAR